MRNAILAIFTFAYLGAVDFETSSERENFEKQGHFISENSKLLNIVLNHLKSHYQGFNVNVFVNDGEVTLKGTVKSERDKTSLENEVKAISGVTSVKNELLLK